MAEHSHKWMQLQNSNLGGLPLGALTFPSSHNAGTSYVYNNLRTEFGEDGVVLTQTRSILEQLELGVRYFDIRPVLTTKSPERQDAIWACGHYSNLGPDLGGVQGASCAPIQSVVDDINQFTRTNAELIVIHIKRTQRIHIVPGTPAKPYGDSTERNPSEDEWNAIFNMLAGINHRYTANTRGASKFQLLSNRPLSHFIGKGQSSVIGLIEGYKNDNSIFQNGFWPVRYLNVKTPIPQVNLVHSGREETEDLLSIETNWLGNSSYSLAGELDWADEIQSERLPWILQRVGRSTTRFDMDKIETLDLLTVSLANSIREKNDRQKSRDTIVVYGGKLVTEASVVAEIENRLDQGRTFGVSNENLGGDPVPGMRKSCAVIYWNNGVAKARFAQESEDLHFDTDILHISYGDEDIMTQSLYDQLLFKLVKGHKLRISDDTLDPTGRLKGYRKRFSTTVRKTGGTIEQVEGTEGDIIDFSKLGNNQI